MASGEDAVFLFDDPQHLSGKNEETVGIAICRLLIGPRHRGVFWLRTHHHRFRKREMGNYSVISAQQGGVI